MHLVRENALHSNLALVGAGQFEVFVGVDVEDVVSRGICPGGILTVAGEERSEVVDDTRPVVQGMISIIEAGAWLKGPVGGEVLAVQIQLLVAEARYHLKAMSDIERVFKKAGVVGDLSRITPRREVAGKISIAALDRIERAYPVHIEGVGEPRRAAETNAVIFKAEGKLICHAKDSVQPCYFQSVPIDVLIVKDVKTIPCNHVGRNRIAVGIGLTVVRSQKRISLCVFLGITGPHGKHALDLPCPAEPIPGATPGILPGTQSANGMSGPTVGSCQGRSSFQQ